MLLTMIHEMMMQEARDGCTAGISIGGTKVDNLRDAVDVILICDSKEQLKICH